jgi:PhnB protein
MAIQPYLFFNGRTEEALEFYRQTLGAEILMKMRFKEAPDSPPGVKPPPDAIMHSSCARRNSSRASASASTPSSPTTRPRAW